MNNTPKIWGAGIALATLVWILSQFVATPAPESNGPSHRSRISHEVPIPKIPGGGKPKVPIAQEEKKSTVPNLADFESPFEFQNDLNLFANLKRKIFLSQADERERQRLLTDSRLLKALGARLQESSVSPAVANSQDLAVDLLIEAVKSGDKAMASEALGAVVADPQIENDSLDPNVRRNLAGIKAEVLYQWTAADPAQARDMSGRLPGPVSQKIWTNVVRKQESNRSER